MATDITTKRFTATGAAGVQGSRTRVRGAYVLCGASAGSVVIREGGASGPVKWEFDTPAGATISLDMAVPEDGILFQQDPHLTLTNIASITLYYG